MTFLNGGAVASESKEACEAAIEILNKGGNAVDAAIAAMAVQGVTRPFSGGIGGDGFMHIYLKNEGKSLIIDHRCLTPKQFGPDALIHPETGESYSPDIRTSSGMAVGVPGAIKAWEEALRLYGTMTFREVLEPAIKVAEEGFVANANFVREVTENQERFNQFSSTRNIYLDRQGKPPRVGDLIKNPDFGKTYRLIAEYGSPIFYEGEIAEAIVKTVQQPPVVDHKDSQPILSGVLSLDDLKSYQTITHEPVSVNYRGYDIVGPPPVTSGGITVGQILNIVEGYDLSSIPRAQALHYMIEACRFAYADRSAYIGDPKFTRIPKEGLLSKDYAQAIRQHIHANQALTGQMTPGNPWAYENNPSPSGSIQENFEQDIHDRSTIHLSVADREGNIVSFTSTILSIGGNAMVVPGYGFLLNNALAGMLPGKDPDAPNAPRPMMRPLSSMAPTIVMKDGKPIFTIGSPGSETIITTVTQTIINYIDFGMSLPDAIASPRLSQMNHEDGHTYYEEIFASEYRDEHGTNLLEELRKRGHRLVPDTRVQGIGSVTGIEFLANQRVRAAGEPVRRGGGTAKVQQPLTASGLNHIDE